MLVFPLILVLFNVEETQLSMEQDVNLSSSLINCSTSSTIFCLTAKSSSSDDHDNDDEENDDDAYFSKKGLMVLNALSKNKNACENLHEITSTIVERGLTIENLEAREDESLSRERNYANKIADLEEALEEEQTTKESLEDIFTLELSKVNKTYYRALKVDNDFKIKK